MARSRRRDDDDDDEDDRPRKKKRRDDDDEDEEDDAPPKKKSRRRDDDDDDDDRPTKKKKVRQKSAGGAGLLIGLGIGAVVLLGGIVALVWLIVGGGGFGESPQKGFEAFQTAAINKDYGGFYDRLDADTQNMMEAGILMQQPFNPKPALAGKKGRELYIAFCKESEKNAAFPDGGTSKWQKRATVQAVKSTGENAAELTLKTAEGGTNTIAMVKQNGTWRVQLVGGFGNPFKR